ncbi:MAG TPA: hypothetical protein VIM41_07475 [Gammaproteobacteria bacterium]
MSKTAKQHFTDMLDMVTPHLKEERSVLYFEGTKTEDDWDIVVSYTAERNGAKLFIQEIETLKDPFTALVDLYKDGGRGVASKCTISLSPDGEVGLEMQYTESAAQ